MRATAWLLVGWACSGDKDGSPTDGVDGTCAEQVTEPLVEVPATEWDPDLGGVLPDYDGISGRWNVFDSCSGSTVGIKVIAQEREQLRVVTEPWTSPNLTCGCVNDPRFDDDTAYRLMATFEGFEFFVETFPDPGVQGQNVIGAGGLFAEAPFTVRSCGAVNIDPALASAWDQLTTIFRIEGGAPAGTLVLATDEGQVESCELTQWQLIQAL